MTKQLTIEECAGSISTATMRPEDLIPCFMDFLRAVKERCDIVEKVDAIQEEVDKLELVEKPGYGTYYSDDQMETVDWILNEDMFDLLNEIAPDYFSFGSHPGDGADYGFWMIENIEMDLVREISEDIETLENLTHYPMMDCEDVLTLIETKKLLNKYIGQESKYEPNTL